MSHWTPIAVFRVIFWGIALMPSMLVLVFALLPAVLGDAMDTLVCRLALGAGFILGIVRWINCRDSNAGRGPPPRAP